MEVLPEGGSKARNSLKAKVQSMNNTAARRPVGLDAAACEKYRSKHERGELKVGQCSIQFGPPQVQIIVG
jgi:hypothetical protein